MNKSNFNARKKARRYALQALYSWILSENNLNDIEAYILSEYKKNDFEKDYFQILLHDIPKKLDEIEKLLEPHLSRKITELDPIELTILRISTYELLSRFDIPYRVIINEALELAKTFGATDSHKFVNGVLDKLARVVRSAEIKSK